MSQEIEIRLAVRPDDLALLSAAPLIKRLVQGTASTRRLCTTYYDTESFAFARTGVSLRVRKKGRTYIQSVKEKNAGALASERSEWESPLPSSQPDLRFIPDPDARERLIALAEGKAIGPTIETEIRRTTRHLKTETGDEVEFAIDHGEIRTLVNGRETLAISEVELELKHGSPAALYMIARALSEEAAITVSTESKSERGLRAIEGRGLMTFKAGRLVLPANATAEDAFRATLMHCLRHIAQNTAAVAEGRSVEGLHQLRVGLRRLRAGFSAFGEAFEGHALDDLKASAKTIARAFGETRNLDVFATELLPPVEKAAPERTGIAELRMQLNMLRDASWDRTSALAGSDTFTRFLLDLAAAAESRIWRENADAVRIAAFTRPAKELACEALKKRDRKARKRAKHLSALTTEERHSLRIALKKIRYAAEFFASLFPPKDVTDYMKKLSDTQDVFGALNDSATVDEILTHIQKHAIMETSAEFREGAAFMEGWHVSRVGLAWKDAKGRWKRLAKSEPFWA
jgi:triphosphatase